MKRWTCVAQVWRGQESEALKRLKAWFPEYKFKIGKYSIFAGDYYCNILALVPSPHPNAITWEIVEYALDLA